jgi:hypothetical protein
MNEDKRSPQVVHLCQGTPNLPTPVDVDYSGKITDEMMNLIDELCPQDELAAGEVIKRCAW